MKNYYAKLKKTNGRLWKYLLLMAFVFNMSCTTEEIEGTTTLESGSSNASYSTSISEGWYYIRSTHSLKYLDVESYGNNGETNVHQWGYTGNSNQKWYVSPNDDNSGWNIRTGVNSNYYLEVANGATGKGANIQIGTANVNAGRQRFFLQQVSSGSSNFYITNILSSKCLDVSGYSKVNGGNIVQWAKTGHNNQKWKFVKI